MQNNNLDELHRGGMWTRYVIMALGFWLIAVPFTFSESSLGMVISDVTSGALLFILAALSLNFRKQTFLWGTALIGVWLQFAPLLFWAPHAFSYLNDTLVGAVVIAMSVIIPKNPYEEAVKGEEVPPGWSYNPSSWAQRVPIMILGFFAWMFARYMTAFQLGYIDTIWDPVFGDGTEKVITSSISKAFPVPDAGLGALAYTLETLMAAHGGVRRWYTIPWFVVAFAILVVPLGFASILLIMLQPIVVGYWCFWCLLTAVCMLFMIALALDEVFAVLQHLYRVYREKPQYLGQAFWKGYSFEDAKEDERSPELSESFFSVLSASFWGVTPSWTLLLTALLGGYLMFSPHWLGVEGVFSDLDHIIGALTVAISVIVCAEVVRKARYLIGFFGLSVLFIAPFLAGIQMISHLAVGFLLILFCLPKGKIREKSGSFR